MRNKLFKKRGNTITELHKIVVWRNYLEARRKRLFLGNSFDIDLVDEYLAIYKEDIERYKQRFKHSSTIVVAFISLFVYILREFIVKFKGDRLSKYTMEYVPGVLYNYHIRCCVNCFCFYVSCRYPNVLCGYQKTR